jgi:hypothetical protein
MIENYTDSTTIYSNLQQKHVLTKEEVAENVELAKKDAQAKRDKNIYTVKDIDTPVNATKPAAEKKVEQVDDSVNSTDVTNDLTDLFNSIFNKSNLTLLVWFLGIYFVAYFGLGMVFNKGGETSSFELNLGRTLDMLFLIAIVLVIFSLFYSYTPEQHASLFNDTLKNTGSFINNPNAIFTTVFFLIIFYIITYLFRVPMAAETKPLFISIIENIAWVVFVIIVFINFFRYILGISLSDLFSKITNWDEPQKPAPVIVDLSKNRVDLSNNRVDLSKNIVIDLSKNEVFNISNNLYTYDDAQSICAAYSSKLATYDQMEESYKNGAEWCNYGWSDGQMIFFPTQKSTWQELQKNEKHKNDCGRPGINGGYIANPYVKFGVNCYGKKPKPTADDLARMTAKQQTVYPKSEDDLKLESKIKYWKDNADKLLKLNSYNTKKWSEY